LKHRPFLPFALILSMSIVLLGIGCKKEPAPPAAPSGFEKSFTITLTNPLATDLPNEAVVIPVGDIASSVADFNPLSCEFNAAGSAIPYQADDLDGDGKPDEMAFVLNLPAGATALECRYSPTGARPNPFAVTTYARLAWETQNANIGWESDSAAYRFYWGQLEAFGKLDKSLIMALFTADYGYHNMQPWGMDILHVGNASGLGGISLWEGDNRISTVNPAGKGANQYERKVIAAGPVRAVARVDISGIGPAKAQYTVTLLMSAFTGNTYSRQDIIVKSSAGGEVVYSPGIEKLSKEIASVDKDKGYVATWGEGAPGAGEIGLAAIFNPAECIGFAENDLDRFVKLSIPSGVKRTHWILGGWHQGLTAPNPPPAEGWVTEVAGMAGRVLAPVKIEIPAR
jgi:hypothetical protein